MHAHKTPRQIRRDMKQRRIINNRLAGKPSSKIEYRVVVIALIACLVFGSIWWPA